MDRRPNAGHSRSECSGVFEGPSASSLVSGRAKTSPDRVSVVPALASAVFVLSVSSVVENWIVDTVANWGCSE